MWIRAQGLREDVLVGTRSVVPSGLPKWRQLADDLERQIRAGRLAAGSQLPSLTAQQKAGYSQTTTLRAYQELITKGLAYSVHGSGTYVADPVPDVDVAPNLAALEARIRRIEQHLNLDEG